jgi:peptide deformylase
VYDEGCLSIPGLFVEMLRPKQILVRGVTLAGEEVEVEADELLSRLFQHEVDHLNGVLMFDRMTPDQRESALSEYQRRADGTAAEPIHLKLA